MHGLYEFSNNTIEVGRLSLIEGEYDPELDKEYLVYSQGFWVMGDTSMESEFQ